MRISSALSLPLLLAACGSDVADGGALADAEDNARTDAAEDGRIDCMTAGENGFRRVCDVEQTRADGGELVLTIRHPDGGFRRLMVTNDGRGVIAADGAETALVKPIDAQQIEVMLGGNHYRLPATVKP